MKLSSTIIIILTFLVLFLVGIPYGISVSPCLQNLPNVSTSCNSFVDIFNNTIQLNTTNDGTISTYSEVFPNPIAFTYFYFNYTKINYTSGGFINSKAGAYYGTCNDVLTCNTTNTSTWYKNYTIPSTCWRYASPIIELRYYSSFCSGNSCNSANVQCFNGTNWINFKQLGVRATNIATPSGRPYSTLSRGYDQDYTTGIYTGLDGFHREFESIGELNSDFGTFFEQSIYYNLTTCNEVWTSYNSSCVNDTITKLYSDSNNCGTSYNLPLDNGTTSYYNCSLLPPTCTEIWYAYYNPSVCMNGTQLKYYEDLNSCNTTINLPIDNGTSVSCTIDTYCADNICLDPVYANTTCCVVTPQISCDDYDYILYNENGSIIEQGNLTVFNQALGSYFYYFNRDVGTYYTKICDDSTRQINVVEEDKMFSIFDWTLIILFIFLLVTIYLGARIYPLFFGMSALIVAFMTATLWFAGYPPILMGAGILMTLFFTVLAFKLTLNGG